MATTKKPVNDKPTATEQETGLVIQRIGRKRILIPIRGTSPLIINRFSEKAKMEMRDISNSRKKIKTIRNPEQEFRDALYVMEGENRYGFPSRGFKASMVSASRFFGRSAPMTLLRQSIFVGGELSATDGVFLTEIFGEPTMREDVVVVGINQKMLRYRPQFYPWSAVLDVTFVDSLLAMESVLSLIDGGGFGVGAGEWRIERNGESGTYEIDTDKGIQVVS